MAREAEAIREKRARIVKAEAELESSIKLTQGAKEMENSPIAVELRRMQMLSEIGIDNNTTTIVLLPSDITSAAKSFSEMVTKNKEKKLAVNIRLERLFDEFEKKPFSLWLASNLKMVKFWKLMN